MGFDQRPGQQFFNLDQSTRKGPRGDSRQLDPPEWDQGLEKQLFRFRFNGCLNLT